MERDDDNDDNDRVFAVIAFEQYYPDPDNTVAVYDDRDDAERLASDLRDYHDPEAPTPRLPDRLLPSPPRAGAYDVVEHRLISGEEYRCPADGCGESFGSPQALASHEGQSHD